jgi:hypothetical protein
MKRSAIRVALLLYSVAAISSILPVAILPIMKIGSDHFGGQIQDFLFGEWSRITLCSIRATICFDIAISSSLRTRDDGVCG